MKNNRIWRILWKMNGLFMLSNKKRFNWEEWKKYKDVGREFKWDDVENENFSEYWDLNNKD